MLWSVGTLTREQGTGRFLTRHGHQKAPRSPVFPLNLAPLFFCFVLFFPFKQRAKSPDGKNGSSAKGSGNLAGGQVQAFGQAAGGLCRSPEKRFSEVRGTAEGLEAGLLEGRRSGDQDVHRPVGAGSYCRRHGLWGGKRLLSGGRGRY